MLPKLCPPKDAQAKVDGCGIQSVNVAVNLHFEIVTVTTMANSSKILQLRCSFAFPQIPSSNRLAETEAVVFGFVSLQT